MTDQSQHDKAPAGGAPQPRDVPREIRPDEIEPTPAADPAAPLPDMPLSRDPLLNPGPTPIDSGNHGERPLGD